MHPAIYSIISVIVVSLISLVGLFTFGAHAKFGQRWLNFLVSFSVGALLGDAFIHILPELAETNSFNFNTSLIILASIVVFFLIEKYVHWHHHFTLGANDHKHNLIYTNLIGDGIHNLIDGMVIAAAYMLNFKVGLATTLAVILHEIPQEVGDFGILLYAGLTRARALFYNFLSALTAIAGAVFVLTVGSTEKALTTVAAIGAGSFIYIATADLIPEVHKEKEQTLTQILAFGLGIAVMFALLLLD